MVMPFAALQLQGVPEKTAQSLMHCNFTTVSHRVTRFHRNVQILFDNKKEQSLNNVIIYCLSSSWKVNYSKTSILTTFLMQFLTEVVCNKHISQNQWKRCSVHPLCEWMANDSRLDHWPIAPLISSWLIIIQQLFRTCFKWSTFLNF